MHQISGPPCKQHQKLIYFNHELFGTCLRVSGHVRVYYIRIFMSVVSRMRTRGPLNLWAPHSAVFMVEIKFRLQRL